MKSKNFIKTPLGQFKQQCSDSERKFFGGGSLSVDAIEDIFWAQLCKADKCYSLNNEISLFPDSLHIWNLNRLTDAESNLHGKRTHHFIDVSNENRGQMRSIQYFTSFYWPYRFVFYIVTAAHGRYSNAIPIHRSGINGIRLPFGGWRPQFYQFFASGCAESLVSSLVMLNIVDLIMNYLNHF